MNPELIKALASPLQTVLWIVFICGLLFLFRRELKLLRKIIANRLEGGSAFELGPVKIGERIDNIEKNLERTRQDVEDLLEHQKHMEEEYLRVADEFDPEATTRDIDALGRRLKSLAGGLGNLAFLKNLCKPDAKQKYLYAVGCAIQERPQYDFGLPLASVLESLSSDPNLRGFRLRVLYKLVQATAGLLIVDAKRHTHLIEKETRKQMKAAIEKLAHSGRAKVDSGPKGIVSYIEQVIRNHLADV